jgi:hypothetical protein
VLGMEHEHQNPFAGIKWHELAVYDALAKPPNNWDRDTTYPGFSLGSRLNHGIRV